MVLVKLGLAFVLALVITLDCLPLGPATATVVTGAFPV